MKKMPEIIDVTEVSPHKMVFTIKANHDLFWFKGHFPIQPILPGVTQTHWVIRLAYQYLKFDNTFVGIERIKFQKPIFPEDVITLTLDWNSETKKLAFEYLNKNADKISHGRVAFHDRS